MIQICSQCGAVNEGHGRTCCFCDAPLLQSESVSALASGEQEEALGDSAPVEGNLAVQPDWRLEVAHRLEAYRARRRRFRPDDSQAALPFANNPRTVGQERGFTNMAPGPAQHTHERGPKEASRVERVEIAVTQPGFDFGAVKSGAQGSTLRIGPAGARSRGADEDSPILPVARLSVRQRAGALDAAFLLLAYGGFLGLFGWLGGRFSLGKLDAVVCIATLILFYAQYFGLFTIFGGSTPGMLLCKLRVVSFDATPPAPRQLLWRSFGYLVSGGTVLLGFLWALWDEDQLTWQDRISQTYITAAEITTSEQTATGP